MIVFVWQILPYLVQEPLQADWSDEANEYWNNYIAKIFIAAGVPGEVVVDATGEARILVETLVDQTDHIVHQVDVRVGLGWTWWEQYGPNGTRGAGRYPTWEAVWDRVRSLEEIAGVELSVDWSDQAWEYYNPWDSDCWGKVIRSEVDVDTQEFRDFWSNATVKAGELGQTDGVVDLADLGEAIALTLNESFPASYPTVSEARARVEVLEAQVACESSP